MSLPAFADLGPTIAAMIRGGDLWGAGWYRDLPASVLAADLAGFGRMCGDGYELTAAEADGVREAEDWLAEAYD